ncbi:MerR family transcriptional regulator [Clostridiaceae bacterium UIB06]|uniref:MerR family transcriptional regulator n=1 Tax=Clostridium thailandense TaxID=2794346 RepID=A0A949U0P6_9CLOT|nr:MerR family transcriptional regulator [Clostridium thailandense]MBV7275281.1 MerR family transcriptional regulator [Clostridium thailandense]MCH5135797.1 MerR family transcriptional regulator [Clostridiaceae bacterium UIB06]
MQNKEFMTVGELAKKMDTTVRTLQYYDKEGLLKPSAQSEGGRRLYTNKDMIKLHQILSMKFLGFSIDDIKNRLIPLDTPQEVENVLSDQAQIIKEKIFNLTEALSAIEALKDEVKQMNIVDFEKYADIIKLLQMKNENYWIVKLFDDKLMANIRKNFTENSGKALFMKWESLCDKTAQLKIKGEPPESDIGQEIAKEWWNMVLEFTGGDMSMLPELQKFNENKKDWIKQYREKQEVADEFICKALSIYFQNQGIVIPNMEVPEL